MNKKNRKADLRPEYDFSTMSGGVRGKYAKAYRAGTNIAVLADDVASFFPTDDSVNRALRAVLDAAQAIPQEKRPSIKVLQRTPAKRTQHSAPRRRRGGDR